jgi:hypothetical protein
MSVKVICGYNDAEFTDEMQDMLYDHFSPDDWDYIIIGDVLDEVDGVAYTLSIFEYKTKEINGKFVSVTYHS